MNQIKTPLGKVQITPKGEYDITVNYDRLDLITYKGGSWIVTAPFINIEPTKANPNVQLVAEKGDSVVSLSVGTTVTGAPETVAAVTNVGTTEAAILNFSIPKGEKGDKGLDGETEINKTSIEAVLTGDLTSHTHDTRYYTQPQVDEKLKNAATKGYKMNLNTSGTMSHQTFNEILAVVKANGELLAVLSSDIGVYKPVRTIVNDEETIIWFYFYNANNVGNTNRFTVYGIAANSIPTMNGGDICPVKNNLTSNEPKMALSAAQGVVLNAEITDIKAKYLKPSDKSDNVVRGLKNGMWESFDMVPDHNISGDSHADIRASITSGLTLKADKTSTYTKAQIDAKIDEAAASIYNFRGNVASVDLLPTIDNGVGDVYNCLSDDANYAWTGEEWDSLGGIATLATNTDDGLLANEDFVKLQTVEEYAQPNTIENVSVDGVTLPISNKKVNIVLPIVKDEVHIGTAAPTGKETVWIDTDDTTFDQTIVTEAPADGKLYGRNNKKWEAVKSTYDEAVLAGFNAPKYIFDERFINVGVPIVYKLPSEFAEINGSTTSEKILELIGGSTGWRDLSVAIRQHTPIMISREATPETYHEGTTYILCYECTVKEVSVNGVYDNVISLDFDYKGDRKWIQITKKGGTDTCSAYVAVTQLNIPEVSLIPPVWFLTNESTSDSISNTIGGVDGFAKFKDVIKDLKKTLITRMRNEFNKYTITDAKREYRNVNITGPGNFDDVITVSWIHDNIYKTVSVWHSFGAATLTWYCKVTTAPFVFAQEGKSLSTNDFTNEYKEKVDAAINGSSVTKELVENVLVGNITSHTHDAYVAKEEGKQLTSNDFTNAHLDKVDKSLVAADITKAAVEKVLTGEVSSHSHDNSAYVTAAELGIEINALNTTIQVVEQVADSAHYLAQEAHVVVSGMDNRMVDVESMQPTLAGVRTELTSTTTKTTTLGTSVTALQTTTTGLNDSIGVLEGQMRNLKNDVQDITSYEPCLVSGSVLNLVSSSSSDAIGVAVGGDNGWTALITAIRNNAPILINVGTKTATNTQSLIPSETSIIINGNDEHVSIKAWIGDRMHFVTITRLTTTGVFSASGSVNRVVIEVAGKALSTNDFTDEYKTNVEKSLRLSEVSVLSTLASMPISGYNLLYTYTSATVVGIAFAATPSNGSEFVLCIKNATGAKIVQPLPNTGVWQSPSPSVDIPAGKVVEVFIKRVHDVYIIRT